MPKTFNMFLGPLGSLFLIGMFLPRATGRTATPAVLGAVVVSVVWNYWKEILSIPLVWKFASHVFERPVRSVDHVGLRRGLPFGTAVCREAIRVS